MSFGRGIYNKRKKISVPDDPKEAFNRALKTALNIVGYKDNTERALAEKLSERGYDEETVASVLLYMKEKGFVNDSRMIYSEIRRLAVGKLYGKARIKRELSLKKFSNAALSSLDWESEELWDVDFAEICFKLLLKRHGAKDQKTYAALMRYGHSPSDIKKALARLPDEGDGLFDDEFCED